MKLSPSHVTGEELFLIRLFVFTRLQVHLCRTPQNVGPPVYLALSFRPEVPPLRQSRAATNDDVFNCRGHSYPVNYDMGSRRSH